MGIYISNMEKPCDCRVCYFQFYYDSTGMTFCEAADKVLAENRKAIPFDGTPDWCPMVYLNTPLTRYFDKQASEKKYENIHGC